MRDLSGKGLYKFCPCVFDTIDFLRKTLYNLKMNFKQSISFFGKEACALTTAPQMIVRVGYHNHRGENRSCQGVQMKEIAQVGQALACLTLA